MSGTLRTSIIALLLASFAAFGFVGTPAVSAQSQRDPARSQARLA